MSTTDLVLQQGELLKAVEKADFKPLSQTYSSLNISHEEKLRAESEYSRICMFW